MACGIKPPAVEVGSLNHWTTGEVPEVSGFNDLMYVGDKILGSGKVGTETSA